MGYFQCSEYAEMFQSATSFIGTSTLSSDVLSYWDTSSVNDMSYMFSYAASFTGQLSNWIPRMFQLQMRCLDLPTLSTEILVRGMYLRSPICTICSKMLKYLIKTLVHGLPHQLLIWRECSMVQGLMIMSI